MVHKFRFDSIRPHILSELSTKVACDAPRDSASIPTAPDPAQRSRKRASSMRGAMTLKRVSRRRSEVGRTCIDGGLRRTRPRYFPAMIRTVLASVPPAVAGGSWFDLQASHKAHYTRPLPQAVLTYSHTSVKTETGFPLAHSVKASQLAHIFRQLKTTLVLCYEHAACSVDYPA